MLDVECESVFDKLGLMLIAAIVTRVLRSAKAGVLRFVRRGLQTRSEQETRSEGVCNPRLTLALRPILEPSPINYM